MPMLIAPLRTSRRPLDLDTTDYSVPFIPSPEDEAAYLALLADDDGHDDIMAETFLAMREETLAGHYDRWDLVSENELIECRGYHPSVAHQS